MGKFFLFGIFLGAAVTWSVMHFIIQRDMVGPEELKKKVEDARKMGKGEGRRAKDKEFKAKLEAREAGFRKTHEAAVAELDGKITALDDAKKKSETEAAKAGAEITKLTKNNRDLAEENRQLKFQAGGSSPSVSRLLEMRMALIPVQIKLWRALGEVMSVLAQAERGWPNVALARRTNKALAGLSKEHAKLARSVKAFIEQNSKELAQKLGNLAPHRKGVQDRDVKMIENLAGKIGKAVANMKHGSVKVPADAAKNSWTDAEVQVKPGDVIHVRAGGGWRMSESLAPSGPEGWDGNSQHKITQAARAGGLILRIGVSQDLHPAYLGKPIIAKAQGHVAFRINDKDPRGNAGWIRVEMVSADPEALRKAVALWKKITAKSR